MQKQLKSSLLIKQHDSVEVTIEGSTLSGT